MGPSFDRFLRRLRSSTPSRLIFLNIQLHIIHSLIILNQIQITKEKPDGKIASCIVFYEASIV